MTSFCKLSFRGLLATLAAILAATAISWAAPTQGGSIQELRNIVEMLCSVQTNTGPGDVTARRDEIVYERTMFCTMNDMESLVFLVDDNNLAESVATAFSGETGVGFSQLEDFLQQLLDGSGPGDRLRVGSYRRYSFGDMVRLGTAPFVKPDSLSAVGTAYAFSANDVPNGEHRYAALHDGVISGSVAVAVDSSGVYRPLLPSDESWNDTLAAIRDPSRHDGFLFNDVLFLTDDTDLHGVDVHTPVIAWDARISLHRELLRKYMRVLSGLVMDAVFDNFSRSRESDVRQ